MTQHKDISFTGALKNARDNFTFETHYENNYSDACFYSTFVDKNKHLPIENLRFPYEYICIYVQILTMSTYFKRYFAIIPEVSSGCKKSSQMFHSSRQAFNNRTLGRINNLARRMARELAYYQITLMLVESEDSVSVRVKGQFSKQLSCKRSFELRRKTNSC